MSFPVNHGLASPVLVPTQPDWTWDYMGITTEQLVGLTDEQLAEFDPLAVNLIVAKGIPRLADLDIRRYQDQVNQWAADFATNALLHCGAVGPVRPMDSRAGKIRLDPRTWYWSAF